MGDTGVTAYLTAAYAGLGEWDSGEAALAEAFALPSMAWSRYPDTMPAHYAKGRLLYDRGRQAEAIEEVQRGLDEARAWVLPTLVAWGCLIMSDIIMGPADKR